uniref:uncharacterized protein LOC113474772 isoform X2 n=1 Tax=Ciona intestinalis TaxID=7719 RepID=UPI000EF4CDC7|nr:uncharacterized protein LOC113474772 isoform X2 [Ciona intestinalis]|eukprot:XP_026692967.1 uncharacterized protein LOC113474772 isoform X2 [Ciona intestinalis]
MASPNSKCYQQRDWKVEPRSIFDFDPLEEGIESRSLSHLHMNAPKTVYEGYGQRDLVHWCVPKVKGIEAKPAISWVHGGITRQSNADRLAEASSKFARSGVRVNGVDINQLLAEKDLAAQNNTQVPARSGVRVNGVDINQLLAERDAAAQMENNTKLQQALQAENREEVLLTPDFVFLPPALPPMIAPSVYTPAPYKPTMAPIPQPLYKNFNRCAKPFSKH